ncbi:mitochondrial carrier domain-containing protein [Pavlovales sp. CCMP2436]|nr:mitochondrial carrier domain-containing protein [Pavlovales sp. CCMP2436]
MAPKRYPLKWEKWCWARVYEATATVMVGNMGAYMCGGCCLPGAVLAPILPLLPPVGRSDALGEATAVMFAARFSPFYSAFTAQSASEKPKYDLQFYLKGALSGGICCGITHGALTPVDVVKTRIQLQPDVYNKGFVAGFNHIIKQEGASALLTGFTPTFVGYFIQGWFKFGGVEFFKINISQQLGAQGAWDNRNSIYLGSAAMFIADIFLCPLEATRIRLVSNPQIERRGHTSS